jgi:hypothetical protein
MAKEQSGEPALGRVLVVLSRHALSVKRDDR